jgi:enoyl-CoA hydratase
MEYVEREEAAEDGALLRLSRPPVNALWIDLLAELVAALEQELVAGTRAIVLTGAGSCFAAGIVRTGAAGASVEERAAGVTAINRTVSTLLGLPIPVVCALNGHALGGGLVIPLACDIVVATREPCKIGLTEVSAGVPFPAVALAAVRARLSPPVFNNLCLTGRVFGPEEALELGVADELSDADGLVTRSVAIAAELASFPAYARVKEQVRAPQLDEMTEMAERDPMLGRWIG